MWLAHTSFPQCSYQSIFPPLLSNQHQTDLQTSQGNDFPVMKDGKQLLMQRWAKKEKTKISNADAGAAEPADADEALPRPGCVPGTAGQQ